MIDGFIFITILTSSITSYYLYKVNQKIKQNKLQRLKYNN